MVSTLSISLAHSKKNISVSALSSSSSDSNFIRVPPQVLKWENRKHELLKEILRSGADIVCLEEVDHFPDFFQPQLKEIGFKGFFKPKPLSPCLSVEGNSGPDGCALFYREEKFSCEDKRELTLRKNNGEETNQVAIFAKLQLREAAPGVPLPQLCVAVTHLKSKSKAVNVRVEQGTHLYSEMKSFCGGLPGVICGDFNALPTEPVISHFRESSSWLESAYFTANGGKEPELTSWKFRPGEESKYTIDYIWYTAGQLQVKAVWSIPTEEEIGEDAMPGSTYPSDHIALCTKFALS